MTPSKDGSQWLPGPERDTRPRADWVPNHPIYWTSVRTPWLSMTLALILDLIAIGAIVGGAFMALNGDVGAGVALLLGGSVYWLFLGCGGRSSPVADSGPTGSAGSAKATSSAIGLERGQGLECVVGPNVTNEDPKSAPAGVQIALALVAIAGGLVLLSDGIIGWSAADQFTPWSYVVLAPLFVVPGVVLVVRAVRRLRPE